ncbi:PilZ domain-containing protein [Paenibacillus mesophilus]|uniref:PilZ domain-containing protein n=1 Tax=Paenibacillus mesophilus TaxID=2582849 RepID=UPI00110D4C00|nr:PilZ domain-containing protein [Paenibacillus mesophilus]
MRRKNFRVKPLTPISAAIRIVRMNGIFVQSRETTGHVHDLGPDGIRFGTKLTFPLHVECVLEIRLLIAQTEYQFKGHIVWGVEGEHGNQYGVRLLHSGNNRRRFAQHLYDWALMERPAVRRSIELYELAVSKRSDVTHGR